VFSAIAGDTLRSLNIPPDMPVKQMVVSDDSAPVAPAAPTLPPPAAKKLSTSGGAKKMTIAANAKSHPGVVR
jgi:cell division protein FtsI (penicillin-binding protein 3)